MAYYFARDIYQKQNVAIGLIETFWGGTTAESWTSLRSLSADASLMPVFAERSKMVEDRESVLLGLAREERAYQKTVELAKAEGKPSPDQPSIAVLPFANMSGDVEQEYFADGITEDVITDLSRIGGLLVIARNSSFAYKGKAVDIRVVARELGVRSILEGSIRRAGNRVRITAQLIDARHDSHLWAQSYERDLGDILDLQRTVALEIAMRVKANVGAADRGALPASRPIDPASRLP